ncbi:hypothetical protein VNO77_04408 [Canavalia gladiata]|uniref:Ribosomal protein L34Ae n=1 Tax=Canavalia gladiata TaxID=3824 RepID=A0AAN9RD58_CANGL
MGSKNLVMLKTHINLSFANDFVYENVIWALASLWVFFCNYVLYSLGLILRYIFRFDEFSHMGFQAEDRKYERLVAVATSDQIKRNQFAYSDIEGFTQELANLLFPCFENLHVASEEEGGGETECSVLKGEDSDKREEVEKREETECSVSKEKDSDKHGEDEKIEEETEECIFVESIADVYKDVKRIDENEAKNSISIGGDSNFHQDKRKKVEEEKTEDCFFIDTNSAVASRLLEEEEPKLTTFTFRKNYTVANVSSNDFSITVNTSKKEFSEQNLKEGLVVQEKEEDQDHSVQAQRTFTSNSTSCDSSDDDYAPHDKSLPSDLESQSSSNNIDDSVTHQILTYDHSCEVFDSESLKDERVEDTEKTQFSCESKVSESLNFHLGEGKGEEVYRDSMEKTKETILDEWDCDEEDEDEDEDEFEWEHDGLLEQLRLELKNARQGGLSTIEEEEDEEAKSPKFVEDLKPLKIEEKIEYKDHIIEIQKVYRCYAEKIRKLDVLNYQTMHAIGLLQLKDPLKLLVPKSTVLSAKPLIPQNLLPRKAPKHISDPILKFVHELHRDLELVYVGQVCLSWEILCWQHKKIQELKQYDSQWPRRYNLVAGEFQLFQVFMQRFLEDEPFQDPRIQNYVKNRCVIRNLLQVPAIKDDNTKDKKKIKWVEEDPIDSERLAQIIKESMRVFWEFVRADKDHGNAILKASHQTEIDVKDPAISDLLGSVQTQLKKKEKKLKDIVRSGNCIVRKFQKHNEDQIQLDHEQLLAQVGLRLVSRVVHMKKLNKDQLIWCNEKLNRIKFVGRKVLVEPSFSLFPC